jgi:hypothetical protein
LPVTVCGPPAFAVQTLPLHVPSEIVNVVNAVTSPSELFALSKPWAL